MCVSFRSFSFLCIDYNSFNQFSWVTVLYFRVFMFVCVSIFNKVYLMLNRNHFFVLFSLYKSVCKVFCLSNSYHIFTNAQLFIKKHFFWKGFWFFYGMWSGAFTKSDRIFYKFNSFETYKWLVNNWFVITFDIENNIHKRTTDSQGY